MRVESVLAGRDGGARGAAGGAPRAGDVVHLRGELGSGKTTFVRRAGRAGRAGAGDQSDLRDRAPLRRRRAPSRTSTCTASQRMTAEELADLDPYLDEAIVFVEWPEAGEGRCRRRGGDRARATPARGGGGFG